MNDDRDDDLLRTLWKEQDMEVQAPEIEHLRVRERQLEACASQRNRIEYIAGGIAAALLVATGATMLLREATTGSVVSGTGHLVVAAAILWILARLRRWQRKARSTTLGTPILTHLRDRLKVERDMLRSAWRWYIAPLVPGFALIYGGILLEPQPNWIVFWSGVLFTAAIIGWIAWLNHRAADRLESEISRLDNEGSRP